MSFGHDYSPAPAFQTTPANGVMIRGDVDSIGRQRAFVELLLAFLEGKRPGGALAPFGDADRAVAVHLVDRLRESIAPAFARPWQPAPPARSMPQLVASDLIATFADAQGIAPTDAWIDRLRAVRAGLLEIDVDAI